MKRIFVGNLAAEVSEQSLRELFSEFGTVRSLELIADIFTRKCRGFGFVEMEGHEARAAVAGLDGKSFSGKYLRVRFEDPKKRRNKKRR